MVWLDALCDVPGTWPTSTAGASDNNAQHILDYTLDLQASQIVRTLGGVRLRCGSLTMQWAEQRLTNSLSCLRRLERTQAAEFVQPCLAQHVLSSPGKATV
jgi:hypothetical protein